MYTPTSLAASMTSEAASAPRGMAPPATVEVKASSRKTRAVMAGLAKFRPMPPKTHFTKTMAKTLPRAACQRGTSARRFRASSRPVTTALRSPTVCVFLQTRLKRNSESTAKITQVRIIHRAGRPKRTTPAAEAGSRAMITSSMMRRSLAPLWIWGPEDMMGFSTAYFPPSLCALSQPRMKRRAALLFSARGRWAGQT